MHYLRLILCGLAFALASCGGGSTPRVLYPGGPAALELSPSPVELNSDNAALTFIVQNDVPGVSYTATAAPACQGPDGGMYVAGDGQAQTAVAGTPTMFLAYAVGTAPASCQIQVTSSSGESGEVDATFETIVVQSAHRAPMTATPITNPPTVAITKANQVVPIAISGFTGTTTLSAGTCATGSSGISVNPKTLSGGAGTAVVAPFGNGSISKSCSVSISDTAGNHATIPVTLSIGALAKFTVSPGTVQFGCAGTVTPIHCRTTQTVTLSEAGAASFKIGTQAFPAKNCVTHFQGPIKFVGADGVPANSASGPTATVSFDGLIPDSTLGCSIIAVNDGGDPRQIVSIKVNAQLATAPPPAIQPASAPPCKGNDPFVAVPGAPHGMFVWLPAIFMQPKFVSDVLNAGDPTLCGVSLVVPWSTAEPKKNVFDWGAISKITDQFQAKHLTVNLLFADSTEGSVNTVTPSWVTDPKPGGDGVPTVTCAGDPTMPVYFDSGYEQDWEAFITAAINQFSYSNSSLAPSIGYMRFATAGGAEALTPPHYNDGGACQAKWTAAGFSVDAWNTHEANIINAMGSVATDKQIMVSLPDLAGQSSVYTIANLGAAAAVAKHVGLSFESLGMHEQTVAGPNAIPGPCNPQQQIEVLHWCQAYTKYAGVVPLAAQPITSTTVTTSAVMDIAKLLPYALDNNMQILELYQAEWLEADSTNDAGTAFPDSAHYKAALQAASLVLGASNGH